MGCNFSTSAFFGGKGKSVHFYQTGDELFDVMEQMERAMSVSSFFMMDEHFLLTNPARCNCSLDRMKQAGKSWSLYVFSRRPICKYSMEELVQLLNFLDGWAGVAVFIHEAAQYRHSGTRLGVATDRIKLLGSTIRGSLASHCLTQEDRVCRVACTDFHQFMLYTPVPGTPLFEQMTEEGRMLE